MNYIITQQQLTKELKELGLRNGDIVNIKASMKSIGRMEDGPQTLLNSLLEVVGPDGTIVTESFLNTRTIFVVPFKLPLSTPESSSYAGAFANAILSHPNVFRSIHPIQKFAAIGKHAQMLINQFDSNPVPYGLLNNMAEMGGKNLRIGPVDKVVGVGTTHVAIESLNYKQKRIPKGIRFINSESKTSVYKENWANGCPKGFNNLLSIHKQNGNFMNEGSLGETKAQISLMKKTLQTEMELLSVQPDAFLCKDPFCISCRTTWSFNKNQKTMIFLKCLKFGQLRKAMELLIIHLFGVWHPRKVTN